jgi:DNA repair exonuclease SbcCD ATPase subunit
MIKLQSVVLDNFKRHELTKVNFTGGVNVITGPNYAGKSTILHAIMFALFGAKAIPCDADDMVRRGAKRMKVTVDLQTHDAGRYEVVRTKSGADLNYIDQAGNIRVEATGHSAVTSRVEELIGLKAKRFAQLKYAEQKETEALLAFGTTELHAMLEELSGADTVNAAIKKCADIVSSQEAVVTALGEISLVPDMPAARLALKRGGDLLTTQEAQERNHVVLLNNCRLGVTQTQAKVDEAVAHNREALARQQAHGTALARVEAAGLRLGAATERLRALPPPPEVPLEDMRYALRVHRENIAVADAAARSVADWKARVTVGRQQLELRQTQFTAAKHTYDVAVAGVDILSNLGATSLETLEAEHQADFSELNLAKAEAKRHREAVESSFCPTCKREYDEHHGQKAEHEAMLAALRAHGEKLAARINDRLAEIEKLRKAIVDCNDAGSRMKQAETNLDAAQTALGDLVNAEQEGAGDVEWRRAAVPPLTAAIAAAEQRDRDLALADAAVRNESEALARAQNEQAALLPTFDIVDVPADVLVEARRQVVEAEEGLQGVRAGIAETKAVITKLQDDIEREEKIAGRREDAKKRRDVAKELWRYLRENRDRFMGEIWASVMAAASGFVAACTGGDIERIYRDTDGKFRYVEKGEEFSALGSASGAQRSLMGLGIKIAMSHLARSELMVILLDEPSADMDPKVSAAMTALLGTLGHQVVMVSHRDMDGTMAENVITLEG